MTDERLKELAKKVGLELIINENGQISFKSSGGLESTLFDKIEEFYDLVRSETDTPKYTYGINGKEYEICDNSSHWISCLSCAFYKKGKGAEQLCMMPFDNNGMSQCKADRRKKQYYREVIKEEE